MSQEAYRWHLVQLVQFSSQRRCPDTDFMILFFSMPVVLTPQHNFSFHEINSDNIKFHLSESEM